jgi:hypothetical protein
VPARRCGGPAAAPAGWAHHPGMPPSQRTASSAAGRAPRQWADRSGRCTPPARARFSSCHHTRAAASASDAARCALSARSVAGSSISSGSRWPRSPRWSAASRVHAAVEMRSGRGAAIPAPASPHRTRRGVPRGPDRRAAGRDDRRPRRTAVPPRGPAAPATVAQQVGTSRRRPRGVVEPWHVSHVEPDRDPCRVGVPSRSRRERASRTSERGSGRSQRSKARPSGRAVLSAALSGGRSRGCARPSGRRPRAPEHPRPAARPAAHPSAARAEPERPIRPCACGRGRSSGGPAFGRASR